MGFPPWPGRGYCGDTPAEASRAVYRLPLFPAGGTGRPPTERMGRPSIATESGRVGCVHRTFLGLQGCGGGHSPPYESSPLTLRITVSDPLCALRPATE